MPKFWPRLLISIRGYTWEGKGVIAVLDLKDLMESILDNTTWSDPKETSAD